jgi:homoserine dehydrogenase
MRVQVIGLGGIGKNLLRLIYEKNGLINSKIGEKIEVVSVSDTSGTVVTDGMPLLRIVQAKEYGGLRELDSFERISATKAIEDIDSDAVIELTQSTLDGKPGIDHALKAMENGKDLITANKGILVSEKDVIRESIEMRRIIKYEATVCGSIPVFNLMKYSIAPASISEVEGFFNGTSTFVASMMEAGKSREDAIREAVKTGLAEKNYKDDLEGRDSARKGVILHRTIFGSMISMKDVDFGDMDEEPKIGKRLLTLVGKEGVSVRYVDMNGNVNKNKLTGPAMSITFHTDIVDSLTLSVEHDGPRESAATVLNDIMLTALEKSRK